MTTVAPPLSTTVDNSADDFELLLRQHVKARKVGVFPKQPPFFGPLRALITTRPPSADDDRIALLGRKRPAPSAATEGGSAAMSLLERVAVLEKENTDLKTRIATLERLVIGETHLPSATNTTSQ